MLYKHVRGLGKMCGKLIWEKGSEMFQVHRVNHMHCLPVRQMRILTL